MNRSRINTILAILALLMGTLCTYTGFRDHSPIGTFLGGALLMGFIACLALNDADPPSQ